MSSPVVFNRFFAATSFSGLVPVPVTLLKEGPETETLSVYRGVPSPEVNSPRPGTPVVLWDNRAGARFAAVFPYVDGGRRPRQVGPQGTTLAVVAADIFRGVNTAGVGNDPSF